ncbi:hypothetical protein Tco_0791268 [Tanacetum coccineum]
MNERSVLSMLREEDSPVSCTRHDRVLGSELVYADAFCPGGSRSEETFSTQTSLSLCVGGVREGNSDVQWPSSSDKLAWSVLVKNICAICQYGQPVTISFFVSKVDVIDVKLRKSSMPLTMLELVVSFSHETDLRVGSEVSYRISLQTGLLRLSFLRYLGLAMVGLPIICRALGAKYEMSLSDIAIIFANSYVSLMDFRLSECRLTLSNSLLSILIFVPVPMADQ